MPVFVVNGGESSCPWEEGTLKRQAASITSAEPILLNQPPEEPAVFTVTLGNLSETGDPENYFLNIEPDSVLEKANQKFTKRLLFIENVAKEKGKSIIKEKNPVKQ